MRTKPSKQSARPSPEVAQRNRRVLARKIRERFDTMARAQGQFDRAAMEAQQLIDILLSL